MLTHFSARYLVAKSVHLGNQKMGDTARLEDLPIEETQVMSLVDEAGKVYDQDRIVPATDYMAMAVPIGGFEPLVVGDVDSTQKNGMMETYIDSKLRDASMTSRSSPSPRKTQVHRSKTRQANAQHIVREPIPVAVAAL